MKIVKKTFVGYDETWDISVDEAEHFLLSNGCVSHNTSGQILDTSPSIEPITANVFVQTTDSGDLLKINPILLKLLEEKGKNNNDVINSIVSNNGSVKHLDFLTDWEKDVFKTAFEIDQNWVIELALARQPYIDQAQSVNLFLPEKVGIDYLHAIHWRARNLKTLYYVRSDVNNKVSTSSVNIDVPIKKDFVTDPGTCMSCEG